MINIRYHVFSLIAVFLALAIGLAAGSTVVKESIVDSLRENQDRLESQLGDLEEQNDELELRVARLEETDRRLRDEGPLALLDGRLLGMDVVLVVGEGLDGDVRSSVRDSFVVAGAGLAGEIEVRRDIAQEERAADLAGTVGAPTDEDPSAVAARSLAGLLLSAVEGNEDTADADTPDRIDAPSGTDAPVREPLSGTDAPAGTDAPVTDPPATDGDTESTPAPEREQLADLLESLEDEGFVAADGAISEPDEPIARPPVFVVVGGRPDGDGVAVTDFLADLVDELAAGSDAGAARVVVGDAALTDPAEPRSPLVDAVRDEGSTWRSVTSVDHLEAFAGLAAAALAVDDLRFGRTGHYGVGEGADTLLPGDQ
jgi:Copper transport outer membrane protein, MctB